MSKDICLEFLMANIRASYYQAIQYSVIEVQGSNWYFTANQEATRIARTYGVSVSTACGVIAALSPNNQWQRNLLDAETCLRAVARGKSLDDFKVCTYNRNKLKAWQIATGSSPNAILAGNKVRAFYQCLVNPQDNRTVCIDSHAANIALGRLASCANTPSLSDKQYSLFALAYRSVAWYQLETKILPMQLQAITWVHYRAIRGIDDTVAA